MAGCVPMHGAGRRVRGARSVREGVREKSIQKSAVFGSREGVAAVICGSRSVGFGPRPFSRRGGLLNAGLSTAR
eukprot:3369413-Pyramimonas_sp.AAC.1